MSKFTNIFKSLTCAVLLTSASVAVAQEPLAPMTVRAKADSTVLIMGDRTIINVEVLKNSHEGVLVDAPQPEQDYHGMEMRECVVDSTDLGNGRVQLNYHFTFQAFDPNDLLTIPPFSYAVAGDTAKSEILTFKVLPVELSPELGDINDIENLGIHPDESVVKANMRWYDYIPDWVVYVIIALALVALIVTLVLLYKKNGPNIFVPRKPIPPYDLAISKLNKLKEKRLIENGLAKQFYTEVTDIWRQYLEGRFGIQAMEMTSRQILKQLRSNKETHLTAQEMEKMLEISDYVKFAAMDPSRDEMLNAFNTIYSFVEDTRPEPEPEETPADKNKIKIDKKK